MIKSLKKETSRIPFLQGQQDMTGDNRGEGSGVTDRLRVEPHYDGD